MSEELSRRQLLQRQLKGAGGALLGGGLALSGGSAAGGVAAGLSGRAG
ncbi:MAG: twin-arginine translocation signal domain-containing protein, partial [Planctomycetaceae bacterium]